jgi:hypothetical protein
MIGAVLRIQREIWRSAFALVIALVLAAVTRGKSGID